MWNHCRPHLEPVRQAYSSYLGGVFLRQALLVLGGYSLVAMLRLATPGSTHPIWVFVAALLLFDVGVIVLDTTLSLFFAERISLPMFRNLRVASLRKLLELPVEWHNGRNTLETVSQLNTGAGKVVQTAEVLGRDLVPALIRTILSLIPLLWFSAATAPIVLAGLGAFLWLTLRENAARERLRALRYGQYAKDAGLFTECVQNVQPLVQFGQCERMIEQYDGLQRQIAVEGVREVAMASRFGRQRGLLISITRRLSQGLWIWQYQSGRLDAAMVMYLNLLTEELIGSFWSYANVLERIYEGLEPGRVFLGLSREKTAITERPQTSRQLTDGSVGIELRDVSFRYATGPYVLRDFTLEIEPGSVVGMVGRSGIGKTTLQNLLSRMFDVQQGSISVGGVDIRDWPLDQLRGVFAPVSQAGATFFSGTTVADTIRFPRPDATIAEVIEAAKCACIHAEILRLPDGYQTRLGQGGATLSKGQGQRLGLAQALIGLKDRRVLILDEFTSALDAYTEQQVLTNLKPRLAGKTVIIIAHRLATVKKLADKIVVVGEGGILEQGAHHELVARGERYAELVGLQNIA